MDFVYKCYFMLEDKGELIALTHKVTEKKWIDWIKDNDGEIINFEYKNWTDKSKKTKEEKKATTIKKISLSIVILYRNKTKLEKKDKNKALNPDLNDTDEIAANNIKNYFYPIQRRH